MALLEEKGCSRQRGLGDSWDRAKEVVDERGMSRGGEGGMWWGSGI